MTLIDEIATDFYLFDGLEPVTVKFTLANVTADLDSGIADIPETKVCTVGLVRQIAKRDNKSMAQVHQSMQHVQNDEFNTADTIIELPNLDTLATIGSGDRVETATANYEIIARDTATLRTRIRVGARRLL